MLTLTRLVPSLALSAALLTVACGDDKGETTGTTSSGPTTDGTATTDTTTGTTADTPTTTDTTTNTTQTTSSTTVDPTTGTTTGTTGDDAFVFDETPPDQLVQVDRMGMPAVATAVISADLKDMYNESTPADDAAQTFVMDIVNNVIALHMALDDDLMGLGLTPCAPMDCAVQAGPLVVPDVLKIDAAATPGFPNGRRLTDPVVDITLAVVLLDLGVHDAGTFAGVPVNPTMNDKDFLADFPYVADPH